MKDYENFIVYDKHVAFWGSEFSNFHKCSFVYKGLTWKSSEQAYMAEKAIYFGDYDAFMRIWYSNTPKEAKTIGREVKNFDAKEWLNVSRFYMQSIVYQKFKQNKYLKDLLLRADLADKHFVEGSPVDGIWGVKVSWDDPRIDDDKNWDGLNMLGKVLDDVRVQIGIEEGLS